VTRRRVAVIGGGLAGMTAAAALSRQGLDVTLFEQGGALGGKAATSTTDGITLDAGPTLLALPHLVRRAFEELGAADLMPRTFEVDPQCHYLFDDGCQFTVHRDLEKTCASAGALRTGEAEGLRRFYEEAERLWVAAGEPFLEAPLEGWLGFLGRVARRGVGALARGLTLPSLDALARRHLRTDHLRQFVGRFATYVGASPYEASGTFALLAHVERAFGVHHVEGGMGALSAALGRALARAGVRVVLNTEAAYRRHRGAFLAGPHGGEEEFSAVVVNVDPLRYLAGPPGPLTLSGYVLLARVNRRLALPHHTLCFAPDASSEFEALFRGELPARPTLYVCHPVATDATMAPPGASGLYLMVNAPPFPPGAEAAAQARWREAGEALRAQLLARLRALCPELTGATLTVLGERTPLDFARGGATGGSLYGRRPQGRLGPLQRPRMRGAEPGVFFTGGGTHPGGGVPMVMLSGLFAARLTASHLGEAA
jgi:phytoene dehydrogenase-like protein